MQKSKKHNNLKEKGITLIALVITIIVLLILAGVTLSALTGDSGILRNAERAKEETEKANEEEIIRLAISEAKVNAKSGKITVEDMKKSKNKDIEEVIDNGDKIAIKIKKSGKYYNIDKDGKIEQFERHIDATPGALTQNSNGEYMVESIEDLVVLSAKVNGGYSDDEVTIERFPSWPAQRVILMCDLDFKSPLSYGDSTTEIYNGYLGVEDEDITLMEALTNIKDYKGFIPIGKTSWRLGIEFDGKNHQISNLYENSEDYAGLFGYLYQKSIIKNLTVTGEINSTTYAGGILGYGWGEITNCTNYAIVSAASAGGICGEFHAFTTINSCINYGEVYASDNCGGIAGYAYAPNATTIEFNYCINAGYVSGSIAGGIMGAKKSASVTFNSCLNSVKGNVASISEEGRAGGIIGGKMNPVNFYVNNCANLGSVSGYFSGGIYGTWGATNTLVNCFGGGNITGTYAGGIAGGGEGDQAYNCYYLKNKNVNYSAGEQAADKIPATGITIVTKENLIDKLNSYIDNPEDEGIETTGWKKWTLDKNGNIKFVD